MRGHRLRIRGVWTVRATCTCGGFVFHGTRRQLPGTWRWHVSRSAPLVPSPRVVPL